MHSWTISLFKDWYNCRVICESMHSFFTLYYFICKWVTSLIIASMHWAFYHSLSKQQNQLTHIRSWTNLLVRQCKFHVIASFMHWLTDLLNQLIRTADQSTDSPIDLLISFPIDWFTHKSVLSLSTLIIHWQTYHCQSLINLLLIR